MGCVCIAVDGEGGRDGGLLTTPEPLAGYQFYAVQEVSPGARPLPVHAFIHGIDTQTRNTCTWIRYIQ